MTWFRNPVLDDDGPLDHGDPSALRFLDRHYLYHTADWCWQPVRVSSSHDLVTWVDERIAIAAREAPHWAQTDLWAPEVLYREGIFWMYVSATTRDASGEGVEADRRRGVARSSSPTGPFEWLDEPLVDSEWTIDGHPLRDELGRTWLIYNTGQVISDEHPDVVLGSTQSSTDRVWWRGDRPDIGDTPGLPTTIRQPAPPQPVFDEQAEHWVADFWARGSHVRFGDELTLELGEPFARVRVQQDHRGCRAWRDDALVHEGPRLSGWIAPEVDGELRSSSLTSCLDDDAVYELQAGEQQWWRWGGVLPVEVTLALRGRCAVRFGASEVELRESGARFARVRMQAGGGDELVICAIDGPAVVADVFVAAREAAFLRDAEAAAP